MAMRTPGWWYRRDAAGAPWWRFALWPLSRLWLLVNAVKAARLGKPYRSRLKVLSVGNVTLGGSGKTPIVAELLRLLGRQAVGLSKGHGGTLEGPVRVDPARYAASEVGDEPVMLAQSHPFWIARDRAEGLRAIEATDAAVVVVDDAHQNLKIAKDIHILVVDGDTTNDAWPFGDGGICPYGPMREPLHDGLARADLVVLWMPDERAPDPTLLATLSTKPVFVARLNTAAPAFDVPVIAFAGIAKPWKFEATLNSLGIELVAFYSFPDHVSPSEAELTALAATAPLVTTEKDWVRLSQPWRERVHYLPIRARFEAEDDLVKALTDAPAAAQP